MPRPAAANDVLTALRRRILAVVGERGLISDPEAMAPFLVDQRGRYRGRAPFVVRPGDRDEVAAVVRACAEAGVAMVPQGGNTGLVGGSVPFEGGDEVLLSLARLDRIRTVDPIDYSITVEAGCILAAVQAAAASVDRLFPLSLGAEGSCRIGGNIATNAGGVHVLRYGNTRSLVLGLEVVLPDGRIWDGLRALRKDNSGYDLKQLYIGSEGTLGIITAAVLKLFPQPRDTVTAFVGLGRVQAAIELLARAQEASGGAVVACELMPRRGLDFVLAHGAQVSDPLAERHAWYLLLEATAGRPDGVLRETLERMLMAALEDGLIGDATIAASEAQGQSFWRLREILVEAQKPEGASIKCDVSVPVSALPRFIAEASAACEALIPGIRPLPFGHLGDGNIHYNLSQPLGADGSTFLARWDEVTTAVHDIVAGLGGSISAEHGLGRMKVAENEARKPAVEIEMMRRLKRALDPDGLMNPGKVLSRP